MKRKKIIVFFVIPFAVIAIVVAGIISSERLRTPIVSVYGRAMLDCGEFFFGIHHDVPEVYNRDLARFCYKRAVAVEENAAQGAFYQLGRLYFLDGYYDKALRSFETQIEKDGEGLPHVYYMLGLTYAYRARDWGNRSDWEAGAEAFRLYLDLIPNSPWGRVDLAWIYFSMGAYEAMLPVLEPGLEENPKNPWLHNMLGLAHLNTGDASKAYTHFAVAERESQLLTSRDWGRAYPGNNPRMWGVNLDVFKQTIKKNKALAERMSGVKARGS